MVRLGTAKRREGSFRSKLSVCTAGQFDGEWIGDSDKADLSPVESVEVVFLIGVEYKLGLKLD